MKEMICEKCRRIIVEDVCPICGCTDVHEPAENDHAFLITADHAGSVMVSKILEQKDIPYKMASRICEKYGGNSRAIIAQVYQNFDYVLEFCQHPADRSRKVMTGITEFSYDAAADRVLATRICKYDFRTDCWYWNAHLGPDKALLAQRGRGDPRRIAAALRVLASEHPLSGPQTISPAYYQPQRR